MESCENETSVALGILFALVSAFSFGFGDVSARRAMMHLPASVTLLIVLVLVSLVSIIAVLVIHGAGGFSGLPVQFFGLMALQAVFGYVTGQLLHLTSMRLTSVTLVAPIIGASPLLALLLAVTLGGESPNLPTVIGSLVVVAGVAVLLTDRTRVTV